MKYFGENIKLDIANTLCDWCFNKELAWHELHPDIDFFAYPDKVPQIGELRIEFWNWVDTADSSYQKPCMKIQTGEYYEPRICLDCVHDLAREFEKELARRQAEFESTLPELQ